MIAYKLFRKDFIYGSYGSVRESFFGAYFSVIQRFGSNIIVDFAGVIQPRHPAEHGGAYFAWSMQMSPLTSLGAAYYYTANSVCWRSSASPTSSGDKSEGRLFSWRF